MEILRNMLSFGEISSELESSSVDKAHLKLASAKAVLRLSKYWENKIPVDIFHLALRTVEVNYRLARKLFLSKVHQYIKDRVLDAKYACAFLLDIFGSKHSNLDEDKHSLADVIQMCRQMKARQHSLQSDASSQLSYPEYMLPFLVHALAHHPMCPNFDQCRDVKAAEPVYRILHLFFSMILQGDEDTTSDANDTDKRKTIIPTVVSMLRCIKQSEDVVDLLKSKNSYAIAELGLLAVKHLTQKSWDSQGVVDSVILPCNLYNPSDIKENDAVKVGDVQTWLAEESVSAHFESLVLDVNGAVHLKVHQDEILEGIEIEGNEMPLGKLMKQIKLLKNTSKAEAKEHSLSADMKNDVDILKVVRDINLYNVALSSNIEPSNGHVNLLNSATSKGGDIQSKKRKMNDAKATPIPKRKRSVSARSPSKYSFSRSDGNNSMKVGSESPSFLQEGNEASQSDLSVLPRKKNLNSKGSNRSEEDEGQNVKESGVRSRKKAKLMSNASDGVSDDKSSVVSVKYKKRWSVSGLTKCISSEASGYTTDLIDCRINIWWPLDERFYGGVVKSYDPDKKKHVVLYDDGDVEVLCLNKERWDLVDDGLKSKKKTSTRTSTSTIKSPSKRVLTSKKSKLSEGSSEKGSAKRLSSAKGKGPPKKVFKSRRKLVTDVKTNKSDKLENKSDASMAEPSVSSDLDNIGSGDHKEDTVDEAPATRGSDVEDKSDAAGFVGDLRSDGTDTEESGREATSNHGRGEAGSSEDSDLGKSRELDKGIKNPRGSSENEKTDPSDAGDDKDDEDEPLSTWKRVAKSKKSV